MTSVLNTQKIKILLVALLFAAAQAVALISATATQAASNAEATIYFRSDGFVSSHNGYDFTTFPDNTEELTSSGDNIVFGVTDNGDVYGVGNDFEAGLLGAVSQAQPTVPVEETTTAVQVVGIDNVDQLGMAGEAMVALKTDGTVWTWGTGTSLGTPSGQIDDFVVLIPEQVQGLPQIVEIDAGESHVAALDVNGEVWNWGNQAKIEQNVNSGRWEYLEEPLPTKVVGLSGVTDVEVASGSSLAALVPSTGVYHLGKYSTGETWGFILPDDVTPTLVANTENVTEIEATSAAYYGINSDSTLVAWGANQMDPAEEEGLGVDPEEFTYFGCCYQYLLHAASVNLVNEEGEEEEEEEFEEFSPMLVESVRSNPSAERQETAITDINGEVYRMGQLEIFSGGGPVDTFGFPERESDLDGAGKLYVSNHMLYVLSVDETTPSEPECNGLTPTIVGTSGDDNLVGTSGVDIIAGLEGNDTIDGLQGDDILCGDEGDDTILGRYGQDTIFGGDGVDTIRGHQNDDVLNGGNDGDFIYGGLGVDVVNGDDGNDELHGNQNDDIISGGDGNDLIYAGQGLDNVSGGDGDDDILGQQGHDTLDGNGGTNTINGGLGTDTCLNGIFTNCEL